MTVGIKRVSIQRGFTVLDNAMTTLKRHFMKLMLAYQFTFYSHWRSSCSNCCQSIFNLDKLSWGTRDYWGQNKLVKIRTHKMLPLTMMVTIKIMATLKWSWHWRWGGEGQKGRKGVIIKKTVMVNKKNKDKIFSLTGIYVNSHVWDTVENLGF